MKSTVINTSKEMTAFSDFPPPSNFANYMHNTQLLKYFQMYAKHHNLSPYIRLNNTVQKVRRASDYKDTGNWEVEFTDRLVFKIFQNKNLVTVKKKQKLLRVYCFAMVIIQNRIIHLNGLVKTNLKDVFCILTIIEILIKVFLIVLPL